MQRNHRLDEGLRVLRGGVGTTTQEEQRGERGWREKLQRCQRQLKAKEEEMSRQSQYFENFKVQLQQKLSVAQDREQVLQSRICTLEKQLLEMAVNAATGTAAVRAVRITGGNGAHAEEQDRLPSARGEGEGEEEKKEERRLRRRSDVAREERQEEDEGRTENDVGGQSSDAKHPTNEARLQSFIVSLQEDLKVLLEREEGRMSEQRGLVGQLQQAQDSSHFLGCRVEELKVEVQQLRLSERSWMEEVEELKEENHRLQHILRVAAKQTPGPSFPTDESPCSTSAPRPPSIQAKHPPVTGPSLTESPGEPSSEEGEVAGDRHQAAAESTPRPPPPEKDPLSHFFRFGSDCDCSFQPPSFTVEPFEELNPGKWRSEAVSLLEESPSEESDALREAYRSLGFGEDLEKLQLQRAHPGAALQRSQEELAKVSRENAELKSQLRKLEGERDSTPGEQICRTSADGDRLSASTNDGRSRGPAQEDLIQALNRENRALADRIQELLVHLKLREEETATEQTQLKESIWRLEDSVVQLEQENQEQTCLNSQLTKKTEDDLNTIMELQQKLLESDERRSGSDGARTESHGPAWPRDHQAGVSGRSPQSGKGQHTGGPAADGRSVFSRETQDSTSRLQEGRQDDSLRSQTPQSGEEAEEAVRLTSSIHNLKTRQQALSDDVKALKEQQQDAALWVRQQTEEKQKLTRAVWGLKEEKDGVARSLAPLKQEKEQLSRAVCGLKEKKEQLERRVSGLEEEREQLRRASSALQRHHEELLRSLSRGRAEGDAITQSLQSSRAESDALRQAVIGLKEERDKLAASLQEQRRNGQLSDAPGEKPPQTAIRGPGEGKHSSQAGDNPTPTEARGDGQSPFRAGGAAETDQTGRPAQEGRGLLPRRHFDRQQEESDPTEETEAKLKRSQEELMKSRGEIKRLCSELCQSDAMREEAERRAGQTAENLMRLSEIKQENDHLTTQVKQLQNKLTDLLREKSDILSLKCQSEERHDLLAAQLKAKTVALEELNSEYMALKRGQASRDDQSAALVSLRANYNNIRARYDALLKRKGQTDLDVAPLKAKLSCLVMKCQERNALLAHVMKMMHRRGAVDSKLNQQVEVLLRDAALQDYAAAFTAVGAAKTPDYWTSVFQSSGREVVPDSGFLRELSSACKRQETGVTPEDESRRREGEGRSPTGKITDSPAPAGVPVSSPAVSVKESLTAAQPSHPVGGLKESGVQHVTGKPSQGVTPPAGPPRSRGPSPSKAGFSPGGRLSSPEKILKLQEQLQRTLTSSYEDDGARRRAQPSGARPRLSAPEDLTASSHPVRRGQSLRVGQTVYPTSEERPAETARPAKTSTTLFDAVISRSAGVAVSPGRFTSHDGSRRVTAGPGAPGADSTRRTQRTTASDGDSVKPEKSAWNVTASDAAPGLPASRSANAAREKKPDKPGPGAPAAVGFVKVIKTVGQSGLLIGWERPPLDELFCSNGTFVYGYRVFVDGEFHKSVTSSACTKCVLENVDLSLPLHIGVQTLGSNGSVSDRVHTVYRTSA